MMFLGVYAMKRPLDDFHLGASSSNTTQDRNSLSVLTTQARVIKKRLEGHLHNKQTPEAQRKEIKEMVQELETVLEKSKEHVYQQ